MNKYYLTESYIDSLKIHIIVVFAFCFDINPLEQKQTDSLKNYRKLSGSNLKSLAAYGNHYKLLKDMHMKANATNPVFD